MQIITAPLAQLDAVLAYRVGKLRQDVFVVEQDCPYHDLDGRDIEPTTVQVVLLAEAAPDSVSDGGTRVLGTARVLDDGDVWRVGRVAVAMMARGRGLGDDVMRAALEYIERADDARDVVLSAQTPLARWYGRHGFAVDGDMYQNDRIPHTPMRLARG